ncbi:ATP-binding protein [Prauserella sp. PE36]|uniref:ATP-binding protein n=1 Tax=Prauserella sp. PE36 TaxID=1504709 RepID=UPI002711DD80|nr:ATP-binding protein [Prauserella sp. PE36]
MIDRLVHHAEVISMKGDSYRLKDRDPRPRPTGHEDQRLNNQTRVGHGSPGTAGSEFGFWHGFRDSFSW